MRNKNLKELKKYWDNFDTKLYYKLIMIKNEAKTSNARP